MKATLVLPHPWEMIHHQWPTLVPGPRKRHPLCRLEIPGPSSRAARAGFAAPSTTCSSCFSCHPGALEKQCQNEARDGMDCSRRLPCLVTWTPQLHCIGNYSPQDSTALLTVATERSPPSDPSWNAGWHAESFEMVSRNSKFIETVNFILNIGFSNHGQHRKTAHFWNAHTQSRENSLLCIWFSRSAKAMLSKLHCV